MQMAVMVILGLLVLYLWGLVRLSHKKRLNQNAYIVYLLMNDEIRNTQRAKLLTYLHETKPQVARADQLTKLTLDAIEGVADQLAQRGSLLNAHAMLWNFDAEEQGAQHEA